MDPIADHADKAPPAGGPNPPRDFAPYPKLDPADVNPPPPPSSPPASKSVTWSSDLTRDPPPVPTASLPEEPNPYIASSPAPSPAAKSTIDNMRDMLGRWGKRAAEVSKKAADVTAEASKKAVDATRKAEDLAGNVWQHLRTGPSFAEAAMGRIAQGTKVIAEGGYEKIFRQTFDSSPDEQLKNSFACYLSTSAGPVMGVLYLSTAKLAFCSDNPLSYKVGDQTEWSYYKVVIPLDQLRGANPSTSSSNASEKYVQIVSIDNHEFWFMGFVNYNGAVESLQEALHEARDMQP